MLTNARPGAISSGARLDPRDSQSCIADKPWLCEELAIEERERELSATRSKQRRAKKH
ncbi:MULTISPECIES: hypothetical protein [Sorangium]|uniref:hypothetical protein n=1 Tax=Sorangium TaxID=39643 RepID=UPI003D9C532A